MSGTVCFGVCLLFLTLLLSFPEQGSPQCYKPVPRGPGHVSPSCCPRASTFYIEEPIASCFEQKKNRFTNCRIHAFIFVTVSNSIYCVDPRSKWLTTRVLKLKEEGICCQDL